MWDCRRRRLRTGSGGGSGGGPCDERERSSRFERRRRATTPRSGRVRGAKSVRRCLAAEALRQRSSSDGPFQGRNAKSRADSRLLRAPSTRGVPEWSPRSTRERGHTRPGDKKETRGSPVHTPAIPRSVARAIARPGGERWFVRRRQPISPGSGRNGEPLAGEAAVARRKDQIRKSAREEFVAVGGPAPGSKPPPARRWRRTTVGYAPRWWI